LVLCLAAKPVGYGSEDVGADDEEGEVVLEEGGAEDDEEEADGEDLVGVLVRSRIACLGIQGSAYEGEDDDGLEACHDHDHAQGG
jgi:hypothetical protein